MRNKIKPTRVYLHLPAKRPAVMGSLSLSASLLRHATTLLVLELRLQQT